MKYPNLKVVVITAPTCAGKSSVEQAMVASGYGRVISHTTREPRSGELNGIHYHFVDRAFFQRESSNFMEIVEYDGNVYGAHSSEIQRLIAEGKTRIVIVAEPNGAKQIYEWCKLTQVECFPFYLQVPDIVRYDRLITRFRSTLGNRFDSFNRRIQTMGEELRWMEEFGRQIPWIVVEPEIQDHGGTRVSKQEYTCEAPEFIAERLIGLVEQLYLGK